MQDKQKSSSINLIIVIAIIIAVCVAGYFYMNRDQSSDDLLVSSMVGVSGSGSAVAPVDNQLLAALRDLRRLQLDDSLFKDPIWLSLRDFSQTLAPQEPYRPNPFAPLGSSGQSASSTQQ